jgi:hypothetical protein
MKDIYYNSAVAKRCGKNGIVKAVLINYIYNYNKHKPLEGVGSPACITLAEFAYQYKYADTGALWKRSFIQEVLDQLKRDKLIFAAKEYGRFIYSLTPEIIALLAADDGVLVSFDLGAACQFGIAVAVMHRYLRRVIENAPKGKAYNLSVKKISEVNKISPAQIYRAINFLKGARLFEDTEPPVKRASRAMSLRLVKE